MGSLYCLYHEHGSYEFGSFPRVSDMTSTPQLLVLSGKRQKNFVYDRDEAQEVPQAIRVVHAGSSRSPKAVDCSVSGSYHNCDNRVLVF